VFSGEGYGTPTDLRYCINGIALRRVSVDGTAGSVDEQAAS
jgi:peptide-methionine (R)-S-oxide reductase